MANSSSFQPPLTAKAGGRAEIMGIARISTDHQDALCLDDQENLYRSVLDRQAGMPYDLEMIAGRGSGECLDRVEYLDAMEKVATGKYDLVICEDLGRIARRAHVIQFIELCEDHNTRVIAINDHIDTCNENWRVMANVASMRHELYNSDTAKRIRRTQRSRFSNGGIIPTLIYGYLKPPGAKSDGELQRIPSAQPVYEQMFTMLEGNASFGEIADWLNQNNIEPGPYARQKVWDGRMVARVIFNPLLKGVRVRNARMSRRVNSTGHRKSVKAPPEERLERHCPHLAFIDPDRYDRLIAKLAARSAKYKRSAKSGVDVRANVARKRTAFPGQHATCGICGRLFYWGGHGQTSHMTCSGSRDYLCWNTCSFNGHEASQRIANAIFGRIERLPEFDEVMRKQIESQAAVYFDESNVEETRLVAEETAANKQIERLLDHMLGSPNSEALAKKLQELEGRLLELRLSLSEVRGRRKEIPTLPSVADLKVQIEKSFGTLAATDPEYGRIMRMLAPQIRIYPFRTIDLGRVVARALVTLDLTSLIPMSLVAAAGTVLRETFWVDLHEQPQYVALREQIVAMLAQGLKQREVAAELGTHQATVQRAMTLHRQMLSLGILDPYQVQTCPPEDNPKFRMHKHPRYHFEALPGFPAWPQEMID